MKDKKVKKYLPGIGEIEVLENPTILQEAQNVIYGDRQADYGSATSNFTLIADFWTIILGHKVTPKDVGLCMIALKMAREMNKSKRDNLVDIAGYAGVLEKLSKGE